MESLPDLLKLYGPLALGWVVAAYLGKFVLDRYQADIEARVKFAVALEGLTKIIDGIVKRNGDSGH